MAPPRRLGTGASEHQKQTQCVPMVFRGLSYMVSKYSNNGVHHLFLSGSISSGWAVITQVLPLPLTSAAVAAAAGLRFLANPGEGPNGITHRADSLCLRPELGGELVEKCLLQLAIDPRRYIWARRCSFRERASG